MISKNLVKGISLALATLTFSLLIGAGVMRANDHHTGSGIVDSIDKAPVSPDGLVSSRPSEIVITLDRSLDPAVPGRTLLVGKTIKVTLPEAFQSDGRPILQFPCPILVSCNSAALLQGWPQNPIPFAQYLLSYDGPNTIVITALQNLGPISTQNPGIKQIHLIIRGFTNPHPGRYRVQVSAETGPNGSLETGWGTVNILPHPRPNMNLTSVIDNPPPRKNKIYQETTPGALAPLTHDFLLWDRSGEPFLGVEVRQLNAKTSNADALLVQNGKAVGHVFIEAPDGATGQMVFSMQPSTQINSPVTGLPTGLLRTSFRAGSVAGQYVITYQLNGGNSISMFVTAK